MNQLILVIKSLRAVGLECSRPSDEQGDWTLDNYWLWNFRLSTYTPAFRSAGDTLAPIQNRHHETSTFRGDCHP